MKKLQRILPYLGSILLVPAIAFAIGQGVVSSTNQTAIPVAGINNAGEMTVLATDNDGNLVVSGAGGGTGDVVGPASSTDNAFTRFDSTTGKLLQNSTATLGDTGAVTGFSTVSQSGLTTWSAGLAITAGAYQVGRDADATNQLHFNAPSSSSMEFSFNDAPRMLLTDTIVGSHFKVFGSNVTSGFIFDIDDADNLSTGAIVRFRSNSADGSGRNLVFIRNQNAAANQTTPLTVQQDAVNTGIALANTAGGTQLLMTQSGNGRSIQIDSSATTANALRFNTTAQTSAAILSIPNADALTTGNALNFVSNSADVSTRALAYIRNQNALATGATSLFVQNDSTNNALRLDSSADGTAMTINSAATTKPAINIAQSTQTTGDIINVGIANSLTSGSALRVVSNSASATARQLVNITNSNAGATGAIGLQITQLADATAMVIASSATIKGALNFPTTSQTTGTVINVGNADSLTTGSALNLRSNSADLGSRNVANIENANSAATNATALQVSQASAKPAINVSQSGNGSAINVNAFGTTTSQAVQVIADGLTTGSAASVNSNSADVGTRNVVSMNNANAAATGATVLNVSQQSTNSAMQVNRGAVNSNNSLLNLSDNGTGSGNTLSINKNGGSYGNGQGLLAINRTGSYTGVNGETSVDSAINPNFTLTEPGAGFFNQYGMNINMASVAVTAGAGNSSVVALNLQAGTDSDAASNLALSANGDSVFKGRVLRNKANDIVAAGTLPSVTNANMVTVTGNTNIDFFPTVGWTPGSVMTFNFTGTPTVNHNTGAAPGGTANFQLAGAAGFALTAGDMLTVIYDGSGWREIARTVI